MEKDSEAEFNGKEHYGICYVVFFEEDGRKGGMIPCTCHS